MDTSFEIRPLGAFSLRESALFGFGQRMRPAGVGERDANWDGVMRLAFCLDGYTQQVGVEVRQAGDGAQLDGSVHCVVKGSADPAAVRHQVARLLSLEHNATSYADVGDRDPVIARLQALAAGLRPPLFHSPYEAAAWAALSARRAGWQMAQLRTALNERHGAVFDLAGEQVAAFPTPEQLLAVQGFDGIEPARLTRLHGVARAAADGQLDAARLLALGPDEARADVQRIKGIGPFYADLIVVRGTGFTDVLPHNEPRVRAIAQRLYDLSGDVTPERFADLAESWRPWRTWVAVLLRAAGSRMEGVTP